MQTTTKFQRNWDTVVSHLGHVQSTYMRSTSEKNKKIYLVRALSGTRRWRVPGFIVGGISPADLVAFLLVVRLLTVTKFPIKRPEKRCSVTVVSSMTGE